MSKSLSPVRKSTRVFSQHGADQQEQEWKETGICVPVDKIDRLVKMVLADKDHRAVRDPRESLLRKNLLLDLTGIRTERSVSQNSPDQKKDLPDWTETGMVL